MSKRKLIIFVKAPRPGFVKSRLAASLGSNAAADAYRTLVETLLANLTSSKGFCSSRGNEDLTSQSASDNPPHSIELRFTPDDAFAEIQQWLRPEWSACPQGKGDLGERMHRTFLEAFAAGAALVVLIGSDCPTVGPDDIQIAWTALGSHDLVLGPATDGGYWLIGLKCTQPALFEKIAWSTNTVLQETLGHAATLGLRVYLLAQRNDVDTEKEWQEFLREQTAGSG